MSSCGPAGGIQQNGHNRPGAIRDIKCDLIGGSQGELKRHGIVNAVGIG